MYSCLTSGNYCSLNCPCKITHSWKHNKQKKEVLFLLDLRKSFSWPEPFLDLSNRSENSASRSLDPNHLLTRPTGAKTQQVVLLTRTISWPESVYLCVKLYSGGGTGLAGPVLAGIGGMLGPPGRMDPLYIHVDSVYLPLQTLLRNQEMVRVKRMTCGVFAAAGRHR